MRVSTPLRIGPRSAPRPGAGFSVGRYRWQMRNVGLVLAVAAILIAPACSTGGTKASPEPALPAGATLSRDPASGTVRFLKGQNISRELDGDPLFRAARNAGDAESVARAFLTAYAAVFRLDHPNEELTKRRIDIDKIGTTHVRFDQTYRGLPIPGAELIVHLDHERRVVLVNGTTIATPSELDVTPALSADDARAIAARDAGLAADACAACATDLVVFAERGAKPRLAWRVAALAGAIQGAERTIDAQGGALLRNLPAAIPGVGSKGSGWKP